MSRSIVAVVSLALFTLLAVPAVAQDQGRLVGVWQAQSITPFGPVQTQIILQPNGSYTQLSADTNGHMSRIWGNWFTPAPGVLRLEVQGFAPTQYNGRNLVAPPSDLVQFQFLDNNRLQTSSGVVYVRTQ